ncbi:hypothetical protein [Natrononativus amylolyticus]|uniref:hypothetical protein n=1 Tax=Natrononativus amylolyticus TaxID=2963434 RepID=UPI0020CD92CD|nr:hypothetical protein [Natrononativus amylolyticus]
MSNHSPLSNDSLAPSGTETEPHGSRLTSSLKRPLQFCCFWIAIALPFVHVPLLAHGLGDLSVTIAFLSLLVVNVVALYVGHGYNQ